MAKKIRKSSPTPPVYLFVELVIPWLVMGLVAVLLAAAGAGVEIIFVASIACALIATFLMQLFEKKRKQRALLRGRR